MRRFFARFVLVPIYNSPTAESTLSRSVSASSRRRFCRHNSVLPGSTAIAASCSADETGGLRPSLARMCDDCRYAAEIMIRLCTA